MVSTQQFLSAVSSFSHFSSAPSQALYHAVGNICYAMELLFLIFCPECFLFCFSFHLFYFSSHYFCCCWQLSALFLCLSGIFFLLCLEYIFIVVPFTWLIDSAVASSGFIAEPAVSNTGQPQLLLSVAPPATIPTLSAKTLLLKPHTISLQEPASLLPL